MKLTCLDNRYLGGKQTQHLRTYRYSSTTSTSSIMVDQVLHGRNAVGSAALAVGSTAVVV